MGTTLENGVYLPSEGERNCYAGLKTNWEILDQKVADVTALQQAVAGALHREIVESLPTTDIDPNTIYMILSGTSATENVYNEYMYVNNAWELIGTSATDLTNYYTKAEVDGKLLLKANASDLTSHTGDTTIHVTTADKNKWNNQTYVFRYSSTALVASSTNSNALLDNTDNLKVGDKVIDSSGVLFSITAIDTANSTFTIGTALIDLAQDSDVVHKSGDETIGGQKTFSDDLLIYNSDNSVDTPRLNIKTSKYVKGDTTNTDTMRINFIDSNGNNVASVYANKNTNGSQYLTFQVYTTDNNNANITSTIYYYITKSGDKYFIPYEDNQILLGGTVRRWKSIYATNYYYGNDNVEFSTKFVTTDTAQTISGAKTFSDTLTIYNSDSSQATKNLTISSSKIQVGDTSNSDSFGINFNAGLSYVAKVTAFKDTSGTQNLQLAVRTKDSSNNLIGAMIRLRSYANGFNSFESDGDNLVSLGSSSNKWKNVQTYKVNNLEPSSLSLPNVNINSFVDISGYFTNTGTGETNTYPVTANGWIFLRLSTISSCQVSVLDSNSNLLYGTTSSGGIEQILVPVIAGTTFQTQWATASTVVINKACFIPCQGNI